MDDARGYHRWGALDEIASAIAALATAAQGSTPDDHFIIIKCHASVARSKAAILSRLTRQSV